MVMELKTVYFENPGSENTDEVLRIAKQQAEELGIKTIVVASSKGDTAVKAMDVLQGLRVIVVTYVTGFTAPDTQTFTEENRRIVESKGGTMLTTAHAFAGLSRAMRHKYNMYVLGEVIADTLRTFGQGTTCQSVVACLLLRKDDRSVESRDDHQTPLRPAPAHHPQ